MATYTNAREVPHIRNNISKLTVTELDTLEWLIVTNSAVKSTILKLDRDFGALESKIAKPTFFILMLKAGVSAVNYMDEDTLRTTMKFNEAVIDTLANSMSMLVVSNTSQATWDIYEESSTQFIKKYNGNVRIVQRPLEIEESRMDFFKATLVGRIFKRHDLGFMGIPHLGRMCLYKWEA